MSSPDHGISIERVVDDVDGTRWANIELDEDVVEVFIEHQYGGTTVDASTSTFDPDAARQLGNGFIELADWMEEADA